MARQAVVVAGGVLLASVLPQACWGEGRWGVEVSGRLDELGVARTSCSLKNEFHVRLYWDWDEYLRSDSEETQRTDYAETTVTEEYSTDGDESHGDLTFEAAFLRHFRSGTTLSPGVGVIARFKPYRDRYNYDRYGPDGFRSKEERSRSIYSLSLMLSGGVRWFLSGEFAVSVYTNLVAFTHSKESSEYTYYYPSSDENRTHGSDTSRTRDSVSFTMQPKVYLQYYF